MGAKGEILARKILINKLHLNVQKCGKIVLESCQNGANTPDYVVFDPHKFDAVTHSLSDIGEYCCSVVEVKSTVLKQRDTKPVTEDDVCDFLQEFSKFRGFVHIATFNSSSSSGTTTTSSLNRQRHRSSYQRYQWLPVIEREGLTVSDFMTRVENVWRYDFRCKYFTNITVGDLYVNLIVNDIGKQILGQLMTIQDKRRSISKKRNLINRDETADTESKDGFKANIPLVFLQIQHGQNSVLSLS